MKRAIHTALMLGFLYGVLGFATPAQAQFTQYNGIVRDLTGAPIQTGTVAFTLKPGIDTTISGNARFTPQTVNCALIMATITNITGNGATGSVTVNTGQTWIATDQLLITGTGTAFDNTTVAAPLVITGGGPATFTFNTTVNATAVTGYAGGLFGSGGNFQCNVVQNSTINPAYTSYSVAIQPGNVTTSAFNTYAIGAGPVDISTIVPTPAQQPAYSFVDLFSNGQTISGQKSFTNTGNTYSGGTFTNPILNNATFNTATAISWLLTTPTIQNPTFTTQPIVLSGTFNYSLAWANPAAARSITIPDPGGTDFFVFRDMTQTLKAKTMGAGWAIGTPPASVNGTNTVGDYGVEPVIAKVDAVGQAGSIATTTLFTYAIASAQALVQIDYSIFATTTNGGAGTVSLVINWTDCLGGAVNQSVYGIFNGALTAAFPLTGSGGSQMSASLVVCPATGTAIQYTTTDTTPGTGVYSFRLRAKLE